MSRRRTRIHTRLQGLATPVFVTDAQRRIFFFNSGCEELTGWPAEDVIGRRADYVTEPDSSSAHSMITALCPPPSVFAGQPQTMPFNLPDGHRDRQLHIVYTPLFNDHQEVDCVFAVITPNSTSRLARVQPSADLHAELTALRAQLREEFSEASFIAGHPARRRALQQSLAAVHNELPIWFYGEEGTGRKHLARLVHYAGLRKNRAFVPLDCQALPAVDLKLTLRRAFRGDEAPASIPILPGMQPGTLLLSNVDHLPRDLQQFVVESISSQQQTDAAAQTGEASSSARPQNTTEIRLMASGNRSPEELLSEELITAEFYFLMTAVAVALPTLRSTPDELPRLAQFLLEEGNRGADHQIEGFDDEVWKHFQEYRWPRNVEELSTVIRESRRACSSAVICGEHLPFRFRAGRDAQAVGPPRRTNVEPLKVYLERLEREYICQTLEETRFNKSLAAQRLGMTRPALYRRITALNIADGPEGDSAESV